MKKPICKNQGKFYLGHEYVTLITDPELWGAEFSFCTHKADIKAGEQQGCARIVVGLAEHQWENVVMALMHEAVEFAACRHQCRFQYSGKQSNATDDYTFIMNHADFSRILMAAAEFISKALPIVATEFKKIHK